MVYGVLSVFFFQAEDGIRDLVRSRGLGDVYKRQVAQLLAVIGGDHDDGVVPLAAVAQGLPDAAEVMVDLADHPPVLGTQVVDRRRVGGCRDCGMRQEGVVAEVAVLGRRQGGPPARSPGHRQDEGGRRWQVAGAAGWRGGGRGG